MKLDPIHFLLCLLIPAAFSEAQAATEAAKKPNIVFILTDDLGWGDIGVFYQNARRASQGPSVPGHVTPQLDRMAAAGIQLRDHYCSAPVCAPARASLLLGVHQGHSNVRNNQFDKELENNHTLATVLKNAGYATAAFGKWGLQGGPAEKSRKAATAGPADWPAYATKRGFDFFFGYVRHSDGHSHYPKEDGKQVWENERVFTSELAGCYTTDLFTARAKKWMSDQHESHPDQPFFCYLAFDTPHAKLQYPPCAFPKGYGRDGGLQWVGAPGRMINTAGGKPDQWCHPDYASATWDDDHNPATPEKPWPDVYRRYASSVRRIDDCVGDLRQLLKDLGIEDNTLVIFTSDNGPSIESYLPEPISPQFFRSFGPFDGIKRDCWEAGIRVGALACWPGIVPAGEISREPSAHYDWMATFAELAGVPVPARSDGVSLVPVLRGQTPKRTTPIYIEYYEKGKTPDFSEFVPSHRKRQRNEMQAIRLGDFIGVRYNVRSAGDPFEIFNIVSDPQESTDLAGSNAKMASLQGRLQDEALWLRRPNATAPRPYDDALLPDVKRSRALPGIEWRAFEMASPWVPRLDDMQPSARGVADCPSTSVCPRTNDLALFFTGSIEAPQDGEYSFYVDTDGGALLRIHEATVIDADYGHAPGTEASGTVRLKAGMHPFRLYYARRASGQPRLSFRWSYDTQPKREIPAAAFTHE